MVLIALAVIFLPLILDGQKKNQILDSRIPEKPISGEIILVNVDDIESLENAKTQKSTQSEQKNNNIIQPSIKEPRTDTTANTTSKTSKTPVITRAKDNNEPEAERSDRANFKSSAFVIQLGSFSSKSNAQNLVDKLKSGGYKAYLKVSNSNGNVVHRVLVGPEIKRHQAEAKIAELDKLSGLNSIIISYDPLIH